MRALLITILSWLLSVPVLQAEEVPPNTRGALVIAGGALRAETGDVWRAFLAERDGDGPILIIPSASGAPAQSGTATREILIRYGVDPDAVMIAPLALMDDESTAKVDESAWRKNANSESLVALVVTASAIWFTGGDQSRTTELLLEKNGEDTAVLAAIRSANKRGAPIGGTSAGAAIMSSSMILQGDSMAALTGAMSLEPLQLGAGLGFFKAGLVDQHFGERARLGRLAAALGRLPNTIPKRGYGVDENTALIVYADGTAKVLGTGSVTLLNGQAARFEETDSGGFKAKGLVVGLASSGDGVDLISMVPRPAEGREPTIGREYVTKPLPSGGGPALPGQTLSALLGDGLLDNQASQTVSAVSFLLSGEAVRFEFSQTEDSQAYWGRHEDGVGRYTISGVAFDISPQRIRLEPQE